VSRGTTPEAWEARYRDQATGWERGTLHPAYLGWRADGTLAPGRIVVPGAGRSQEPLALAREGFHVTVLDLAPTAVAFQRSALAGTDAAVVQQDVLTWRPEAPFDAVYDQTCLCALPPALWAAYAAQLRAWLRPGGVAAMLFMQTGNPEGPPFPCPLDRMRGLFAAGEWVWPAVLPPPVPHPAGIGSEQPAVLRRL
jgi:hypothetical protein